MYVPQAFEETRVEVMHDLVRAHPFATLVTVAENTARANHLPFHLDTGVPPLGLLRGHVARANPVWESGEAREVLVIFQGPHSYISPSWYPSKREQGKVVPTWNYAVVHVRGTLSIVDDRERLHAHVSTLTRAQEAGRPDAWAVSDAPESFVEGMLGGIRGLEIRITDLQGKWKMVLIMLTGDHENSAKRTADALGIDTYLADLRPGSSSAIPYGQQPLVRLPAVLRRNPNTMIEMRTSHVGRVKEIL